MVDKAVEIKVVTPEIVHQAAAAIKQDGQFNQSLSAQEIEGLMKGIVEGTLQGNPSVEASVPFMSVAIVDGKRGKVGQCKATIRVDKPIGATVTADIALANDDFGGKKNAIKLDGLDVNAKADNIVGSIALKAVNIESQVRNALSNPTKALSDYLSGELKKDGVYLTTAAMRFTDDNKLSVALGGRPL